ncbi:MAG: hypothetical protein K2X66_12925 [Cyanobacteria bacterium]|nr:hypothetical protein [Cyanobacteriota bacterium]
MDLNFQGKSFVGGPYFGKTGPTRSSQKSSQVSSSEKASIQKNQSLGGLKGLNQDVFTRSNHTKH